MPSATVGFAAGPAAAPPDNSNLIAVLGPCSGMAALTVLPVDDPNVIPPNAGPGLAPELAYRVITRSGKRVLLVATATVAAAVLSAVTQVGTGPIVTVAAATGAPFDDASVIVKIHDAGPAGTGTFDLSYSYLMTRGNPSALYQTTRTIPARTQATATGTIDLTTLVYATAAKQVGSIDLTTLTYGSGGTLAGLTVICDVDDAGAPFTVTFGAPSGPAAVIAAINLAAGAPAGFASLNLQNQLVLTSGTIGAASEVDVTGGTALTALGLVVAELTGVAGALDGLTLILAADTGGSHTATFTPPPANAAAVVATVAALANVGAALYSTRNFLQVTSDTIGSASTLNITGGTGRTAIGLVIPSAPYTGAESTYYIDHLGVTVTFGSGSTGTFGAGTTYAWTCKAARPDLTAINAAIDAVYAAGYEPYAFDIAPDFDVTTALAIASGLETKRAALNLTKHFPRFRVNVDKSETSANCRATFDAFRSRWVDMSARGAYIPTGAIPGGGDTLRPQGWAASTLDSRMRFSSDLGEHALNPADDVDGITENEQTAPIKLVSATGCSFNVIDGSPGAYFFAGGYTSAAPTEAWVDQNVRNVLQRGAYLVQSALDLYINKTGLDTDAAGYFTPAQAAIINADLTNALSPLVPEHAEAAVAVVDTTIKFAGPQGTKRIAATFTLDVPPPARSVSGVLQPGKVSLTVTAG